MFMFDESRHQLNDALYLPDDNGLHTRLEPIARVKCNRFFPVDGNSFLPPLHVTQADDVQHHKDAYNAFNVTLLDPFQHWNDVYNDLRGIFIKPLVCSTLAEQHALGFTLELRILFINLLSLSPARAMNSAMKASEELCYTVWLTLEMFFATATLVPSFALRCLVSIAELLCQLFTPQEQLNPAQI